MTLPAVSVRERPCPPPAPVCWTEIFRLLNIIAKSHPQLKHGGTANQTAISSYFNKLDNKRDLRRVTVTSARQRQTKRYPNAPPPPDTWLVEPLLTTSVGGNWVANCSSILP